MTVVAALELEDAVPSRRRPRESYRGHRRFGPGAHHPHALDRRHEAADLLRQLELERRGSAEARAAGERPFDRLDDRGMAVPQDERSVGADVVDVLAAVLIPDPRALSLDDEARSHVETPEGPHRRVDASGHVPERLGIKLFASTYGPHGREDISSGGSTAGWPRPGPRS